MGALHGLENVMTDLKGLVKPLEWLEITDEDCSFEAYGAGHRFWILQTDSGFLTVRTSVEIGVYATLEAAQAAAQSDYEARILAALDLAKVEALVGAAEMMVKAYREDSDQTITGFYALEAALAAMKGGE
jgi:hypothetical protein